MGWDMLAHAGNAMLAAREETKYAMDPPPGETRDFTNPPYDAVPVMVTVPLFLGIAFLMVVARVYSRAYLLKAMGPDDWMAIAAIVLEGSFAALCLMTSHYGLGHHMWIVPLQTFSGFKKVEYWVQLTYALSSLASKLSIVLLVWRISPERTFRICTIALIIFVVAYHLSIFFGVLFSCTPIAKTWDFTIEYGTCINVFTLIVAGNILNVVADIAMWCLPIPVIWKLNIKRQQKLELTAVFLVGVIIVVVGAIRVPNQLSLLKTEDYTWTYIQAHVWSNLEVNVTIICGCMPTIRPLLRQLFPKLFHSTAEMPASDKPAGYKRSPGFLSSISGNTAWGGRRSRPRNWADIELGNDTQITAIGRESRIDQSTTSKAGGTNTTMASTLRGEEDEDQQAIVQAKQSNEYSAHSSDTNVPVTPTSANPNIPPARLTAQPPRQQQRPPVPEAPGIVRQRDVSVEYS